ncbi:hypothetical protein [Chroococcidiopsis thermalis]|uniref:hypothetical protein n=1 Tax=Chroococcidiopsis thermalis TaxID=54299 RepID=UPI0003161519|nr:hypothetical protein [Chroococcidiopsis thermalis]
MGDKGNKGEGGTRETRGTRKKLNQYTFFYLLTPDFWLLTSNKLFVLGEIAIEKI